MEYPPGNIIASKIESTEKLRDKPRRRLKKGLGNFSVEMKVRSIVVDVVSHKITGARDEKRLTPY
jgi:hypothetical protein